MLSAFESASHSKQVFHSKHVVALGENHPAVQPVQVGWGDGRDSIWGGGEGNLALRPMPARVSLKKTFNVRQPNFCPYTYLTYLEPNSLSVS